PLFSSLYPCHPPSPSFSTRRSSNLPCLTHHAYGGGGRIQAGLLYHFQNGGNATPGFANGLCPGVEVFNFSGGIGAIAALVLEPLDRKSTRLNSSHVKISYAVFCVKK